MEIKSFSTPHLRLSGWKNVCESGALYLAMIVISGCEHSSTQGRELTLPELNRAVKMWNMARGVYPLDVMELTNFPAVQGRSFPKLPPGKKLFLDPKTHEVGIVGQ